MIVACVKGGDETEYRDLVSRFTSWSSNNSLILNTSKTKEMIIDFRKRLSQHQAVAIDGEDIEVVRSYWYLGVHLDDQLDWTEQARALHKKGRSRMYFLRRLKSFNVNSDMLYIF